MDKGINMDQMSKLVVRLENARDEGDFKEAEEIQWQIDMLNTPCSEVKTKVMAAAYGATDLTPWDDDEDDYSLSLYEREHRGQL